MVGGVTGSASSSRNFNLNPKASPRVEQPEYDYRAPPKTRRQKALEKMDRELIESVQEEDKLNADLEKRGRTVKVILIIKDGMRFFVSHDLLADKFHHSPDLNSPIPVTLSDTELRRLSNPKLYRERRETFRNKEILPEAFVEQTGRDLRLHALDLETTVIRGTFGANREAKGGPARIEGYHLYNNKTGYNAFFDLGGNRYRTGMQANEAQRADIKENQNFL